MQLRFASYNIHKAVGIDRRRDPERIVAVLREFDADVIALQEADLRLGDRAAVLPRALLDDSPWRAAPVSKRPRSMGWHGNAILVRRTLAVGECHALDLPTLEPRGAVCVEIGEGEARFRVIGTHLDLSGLRRRDQVRALLSFVASAPAMPTWLSWALLPAGGPGRPRAGHYSDPIAGRAGSAGRAPCRPLRPGPSSPAQNRRRGAGA